MPLNIAAAALVIAKNKITFDTYCLSIAELSVVCLGLVYLIYFCDRNYHKQVKKYIPLGFVILSGILIYNVIYSVFMIRDYNNHINDVSNLYWNMSIAILATNSFAIVFLGGPLWFSYRDSLTLNNLV